MVSELKADTLLGLIDSCGGTRLVIFSSPQPDGTDKNKATALDEDEVARVQEGLTKMGFPAMHQIHPQDLNPPDVAYLHRPAPLPQHLAFCQSSGT